MSEPRVTVVGGGITGLAAAYTAAQAGAEVTLLEAGTRLGGCIEGATVGGASVEAGADAFLARVPEAAALAKAVGLGNELVAPAPVGPMVWSGGRLRRFPEGLLLGVPAGMTAVARSGVLSVGGMARAALDLVLPATPVVDDVSVAELVGRRFGREVVERLVDPLIGGINAGRSEELSAAAVAPQIVAAARAHRSLLLGARAQQRTATATEAPVFLTVRSGLTRFVECIAEQSGAGIHVGVAVDSVDDLDGAVVLAVPAAVAAGLVARRCPDAAEELRAIRTASVGMVLLAYDEEAFPAPLDASGFVVPRVEGRLLTACSFGTSKWPQWKVPGRVVLRVSVGRAGDDRWQSLDDDALVARVHDELVAALGVRDEPLDTQVRRWIGAFPQYEVGHLARVDRIEDALRRDLPHVVVVGSSYRGLGIPACIRQGREAAARVQSR
jgi:oxygen-dependent protoporphyrinogen oxidase